MSESGRSKVRLAAGYVVGFLILAFLALALKRESAPLRPGSVQPLPLITAMFAAFAACRLSAWSWSRTLAALGAEEEAGAADRVWYASMAARYLPGVVPGVLVRIVMTEETGVPRSIAAAATAVDWVLWILSAAVAALLTLPWWRGTSASPSPAMIVAAIAAGAAAIHPKTVNFLLIRAARRAGGRPVPLTYSALLKLFPVYLVKWPAYGVTVAAFLPWSSAAAAAGAFPLGWLAGFMSPFSPGGLGVREGVIAAVLHEPGALQAALLSRLAVTVAELCCWGIYAARPKKERSLDRDPPA